jgi:hypothetical protein
VTAPAPSSSLPLLARGSLGYGGPFRPKNFRPVGTRCGNKLAPDFASAVALVAVVASWS